MAVKIQIRRDTANNWINTNPVLSQWEQGFETDTGKLKIWDWQTAWNDLSYFWWNMRKSTYDTNNNWVVDDAEKLNWQQPSYYLDRTNHTWTQDISTINNLQDNLDSKANLSWGNSFSWDQTIDWNLYTTEQSSAPWTPASWQWVIYEENDWIIYFKNDDWTEYNLTDTWWDMYKSTYDTDNDWIVDNSKQVDGKDVSTTLWTDDTTVPTSKAVQDVLSGYMDKNTYDNDADWVVDNAKQVDWKSITTTLWTDDTTVPTSKAVKDYVDNNSWWWTITTLDILEVSWTQSTGVVSSYRAPQGWTLAKFSAYLEAAPDWADFKVDIKINWTAQATATITAGTTSWTTTTFTNTTLNEWDLITYEITQVGSNVAGADLTLWLNLS